MTSKRRVLVELAVGTCAGLLAVAFLFPCSSTLPGRDAPGTQKLATERLLASRTFDRAGGRLAIENPASPLRGFAIEVPEGALAGAETIHVAVEPSLPKPLPEGISAASPVVLLTKDSPRSFAAPVSVTVPITSEACDLEPVAVYYEVALGSYEPVTVTAIDRARGTLTFRTVHFTPFLVTVRNFFRKTGDDMAAPHLRGPLASYDTGFRPNPDGFAFVNRGDYADGGNCLGMSAVAIQWWLDERGPDPMGETLQERFPGYSADGQVVVGEAETRSRGNRSALLSAPFSDPATGNRLYQSLVTTGTPQILTIWTTDEKEGHAIVVFGYRDGAFQIYDPNFPGQTMTWEFSPGRGFGTYRNGSGARVNEGTGFYGRVTRAATASPSDYFSHADLEHIMKLGLEPDARYMTVKVSSVSPVSSGRMVQGTVSGGAKDGRPATRARIWFQNELVAEAPVQNGAFSILVTPEKLRHAGIDPTRESVVTVAVASADSAFAGATDLTLAATPPPPCPSTPPPAPAPAPAAQMPEPAAQTPEPAAQTPVPAQAPGASAPAPPEGQTPGMIGPLGKLGVD